MYLEDNFLKEHIPNLKYKNFSSSIKFNNGARQLAFFQDYPDSSQEVQLHTAKNTTQACWLGERKSEMEDEQGLDFQSYGILPFTARRALEGIGNGLEESFTPELTSI